MVRIIIKGGVWKNTEDEVLKAAIAKYGKNQWARISSLLVRKTPKQCKARWYEWLDPSIKKTEWSKTEDEKLLHLAKLMPTQWRTIAPIVGRTATQCLERYQKLLDEAEAKENEELGLAGPSDSGPSAEDVRRLRPGEIDPDPETKPARPDPIDMDEDEKEMLSEARARLANTQGKKAKRKARERQLEEARRLAVLQKKRELKEAGIIMRHKTKKKGMDYNADIPFEKKPVPGFYDTSEEQARLTAPPVGQTMRRLENKRKPEEEEAERKKRQRKNAATKESDHQTKFVAARDAQIQKLKEAESIGRRRKLALPAAQVGEVELEEIAKIGQASETAKTLVEGGIDASARLLSDYENLEKARMTRTPRTAPQQDVVMIEARNLRNMKMTQTPLLGEENTPLHIIPGGYEGAAPRHQILFTPNPLATPLREEGVTLSTPQTLIPMTPLRTPLRDNLSINADNSTKPVPHANGQHMQGYSAKRALKAGFLNLPKPENNFELLVPEAEESIEENDSILNTEDAAERDVKLKRLKDEKEKNSLQQRSLVVQRGLPRPSSVDVEATLRNLSLGDRDHNPFNIRSLQQIQAEIVQLLQYDSMEYPLPGTNKPGAVHSCYTVPAADDLERAKDVIHAELSSAIGFPNATPDQLRQSLYLLSQDEAYDGSMSWASIRQTLVYDATSHGWVDQERVSHQERGAGYESLLAGKRESMAKDASKLNKAEKKLAITLGGYQARSQALTKQITKAFEGLQTLKVDHQSFSRLRFHEVAAGPRRVTGLKEEVERLERKEKLLQTSYSELNANKHDVESRIASLEDRLMTEAESFNEAHLAELHGNLGRS
ncbi:hypothetical protein AX17_004364 [Amanita inopinata Kibby_2008]|nr:hypothetical protein AX17_004364 [Amanita inopinata Kibby_2008]